jgi:hypothetical protein
MRDVVLALGLAALSMLAYWLGYPLGCFLLGLAAFIAIMECIQ